MPYRNADIRFPVSDTPGNPSGRVAQGSPARTIRRARRNTSGSIRHPIIGSLSIGPFPAAGDRSEGWTAGDRLPQLCRMRNRTSRDRGLLVQRPRSFGAETAVFWCRDRGLLVLGPRSLGAGTAVPWTRRAHETRPPPYPVVARKQTDMSGTFRLARRIGRTAGNIRTQIRPQVHRKSGRPSKTAR